MDSKTKQEYEIALAAHAAKLAEIKEQFAATQARVSAAKQERADATTQKDVLTKRKKELAAIKNQAIANYDEPGEKRAVADIKKIDKEICELDEVIDRANIRISPESRFPQMSEQLRWESRACGRFRFFLETADKINAVFDGVRDVFNISETSRKDGEIMLQDIPLFYSVNCNPHTGRPLPICLKMPDVHAVEFNQHLHLFVESVKTEDGK